MAIIECCLSKAIKIFTVRTWPDHFGLFEPDSNQPRDEPLRTVAFGG